MKTNKSMQKLSLAILLAGVWSAAFADPVVFNVNLSVQTALGNFNAGNGDGVRVLGLNGDWSTGITMVPSAANTNIYTVTNSLTAGTYPNYLFVITPASGSWSWETTAAVAIAGCSSRPAAPICRSCILAITPTCPPAACPSLSRSI